MTQIKHLAIFANDLSMRSAFIQNLLKGKTPDVLKDFEGKNGVLFSTFTLEKFIKEEKTHDDFVLSSNEKRSITTFSSGEQRKALLTYLISLQPDFLVLDNIFDMLDTASVASITNLIVETSKHIPVIQLVKRSGSILPFIEQVIRIENDEIEFYGEIEDYFKLYNTKNNFILAGELPLPFTYITQHKNPLIAFKNVSINYGEKEILKDINWTINIGDFWQLKGPNGSGKTTLLTMITGDNPKAYGQDLTLFGRKKGTGESIWEIKKKIGYITPSMTTLFRGWNTVEKMVISGLVDSIGLYKQPTQLQRELANQWIDLIGLGELKHTRFSTLNEGQQCMILIARAMIKHPPLLILDEPSHGLNDYNAGILSALVNKIAEEGNTTIIYVSHRNEPGLKPKQIYELIPGENGSIGRKCD